MSDERLTELETRMTYQDDVLQQLDEVVIAQAARIDKLERLCQQLLTRIEDLGGDAAGSGGFEVPPHY